MALVTKSVEPNIEIMAFSHELVPIAISERQRLDDVMRTMQCIRMGATNATLPFLWATANKVPVDVFTVYTDNDVNQGVIHVSQALRKYREATGINAKLIVCATQPTRFSIADPNDVGMLDISGFDAGAPQIISDFSLGLV